MQISPINVSNNYSNYSKQNFTSKPKTRSNNSESEKDRVTFSVDKKTFQKVSALVAATALSLGILTGCTNPEDKNSKPLQGNSSYGLEDFIKDGEKALKEGNLPPLEDVFIEQKN